MLDLSLIHVMSFIQRTDFLNQMLSAELLVRYQGAMCWECRVMVPE